MSSGSIARWPQVLGAAALRADYRPLALLLTVMAQLARQGAQGQAAADVLDLVARQIELGLRAREQLSERTRGIAIQVYVVAGAIPLMAVLALAELPVPVLRIRAAAGAHGPAAVRPGDGTGRTGAALALDPARFAVTASAIAPAGDAAGGGPAGRAHPPGRNRSNTAPRDWTAFDRPFRSTIAAPPTPIRRRVAAGPWPEP